MMLHTLQYRAWLVQDDVYSMLIYQLRLYLHTCSIPEFQDLLLSKAGLPTSHMQSIHTCDALMKVLHI